MQTEVTKKGGPYSKKERADRREKVAHLYLEYGYTINKIAKKLHVRRETVTDDVNYILTKLGASFENYDFLGIAYRQLHRFESQYCRLRERLDHCNEKEIGFIERQIFQVNDKINELILKLQYHHSKYQDALIDELNRISKEKNLGVGYLNHRDIISLPEDKSEMVKKIIKENNEKKSIPTVI